MFNKAFIQALADHFEREGPKVIERVAEQTPAAYLKICALLVPREHKVEHSAAAIKELTDEQPDQAITAIREMLARRAGDDAKVIEGTAQETEMPAPTEHEQSRRKRSNRLLEHVDTAIGPSERGKGKP
jgi:hypothetical protein